MMTTMTTRTITHAHIIALALTTLIAVDSVGARADDAIGNATSVTTVVTGTMNNTDGEVKTGDAIFHNEVITTDANGVGQLEFHDATKLAVGPNSKIVLDDFVYDSSSSAGRVVINLAAGTMRFITGKANHDAYEIVTPTATIGVRGTMFDVYTAPSGEMAVAMLDGAIDVCPTGRACFRHSVVGKFLHMTSDGIFSIRDRWDGSIMGGLSLATALPFLASQDRLVPTLRGNAKTVSRYVVATGKTIEKPLKLLPKLKLPKLFK